jgi:hypothetical protein
MGRETSVSKTISGKSNAYYTDYQYDLAGRVIKMTYPDAYEVNYIYYPASGLLAYVAGMDGVTYAKLSNYSPAGQIGQIDYGGQWYDNFVSADQYTYNPLSTRLEKITTQAAGSSDYLQWLEYKYTPAGDVKEKTDVVHGSTYTYSYDRLHRLVEEVAENKGVVSKILNTGKSKGSWGFNFDYLFVLIALSSSFSTSIMTSSSQYWLNEFGQNINPLLLHFHL